VINARETVAQTALRIVREWAELKANTIGIGLPSYRETRLAKLAEIEADRDIVTAWLLGQDAKQKGGRTKR
jgi:hypothetical protein